MRISIIIPTYNCAKYIKKAIDSVLNQPYENKELIIIDGGSNDNTVEILKSYSEKIKWISEKDSGQSDAINKGFKMATGEIVTWLNADDYYEPDIFEKINNEFEKRDIILLYGKCRSISIKKTIINTPPKNITDTDMINKGNLIYQPSSFYKKTTVEEIGLLNSSLNYWMEYDLFIKLLKKGDSYLLNEILTNFTIREDQKSNSKNILVMDKELWKISKKYGGNVFSRIFLSIFYHKIKYLLKQK